MAEWNHESVWGAIDALATRHKLTPSGLAKKAGLDATAFNPSKRVGPDQRPRWPSTESIAKVLAATGESLATFVALAQPGEGSRSRRGKVGALPVITRQVPLLGFAEAGTGGFFDDGGFPAGFGWDEIALPGPADESSYALKVSGDSMLPLYRDGDVIIVSPTAPVRRGDRVVVKTTDGEVMAKILKKQNQSGMELASFNPAHRNRTLSTREIEWVARIMWASQ
jgi:phage repressor protein C with HTH and peptisase S24 domain